MSRARPLLPALLLLAGVMGCGSARMIQATSDGGVVAIPSNCNAWPFCYRDDAKRLMAEKCPAGYEIVQEEEVVVGQRTSTHAPGDHRLPESLNDPNQPPPSSVVTTTTDKTEYRIHFRAKGAPAEATASVPPPPAPIQRVGLPERPIPVVP